MKKFYQKHEKFLVLSLIAVILVIIAVYAVSFKTQQINNTYHVYTVKKAAPYQGQGVIKADSTYTMRIPKKAQLSTELKTEQDVKKGQVLATLHFPEKETELKQVRAQISDLQAQIENQQGSLTDNSSNTAAVSDNSTAADSNNDSDQAQQQEIQALQDSLSQVSENQQNAAQQQISELQSQLSAQQAKEAELSEQVENQVSAPFAGTFHLKQRKNGQVELKVYAQKLVLEARVSQDDYTKVKPNAKIKIDNSVQDKVKKSKVSFISKLPLKQKGTDQPAYKFSAPVSSSFLMGQRVNFSLPQKGLQLPASAVKNKRVYVLKTDNTAQEVKIKGKKSGKYFIVTSGVKAGAKVVSDPHQGLRNGDKIHQAK